MKDLFLKLDEIGTREQALTWSINAALQRNKVYKEDEGYDRRETFRTEWARLLSREAKAYKHPEQPVPDEQHCAAIARIADSLSGQFGDILGGGRLCFGTSQKAFNLYLKYLWALGEASRPPHCPIDSVVLERAGIEGSWTKCDSPEEYMGWINKIRERLNLAEWEMQAWLRWRIGNLGL
jgi:hypothetical protein